MLNVRIVKTDGTLLQVKVLEVSSDMVKYKRENYLEGPTYTISPQDIQSIVYGNGDRESFDVNKEVKIKSGTPVLIRSAYGIRAAKVRVGDKIPFYVANDIVENGITLIPNGTKVEGEVYQAKRSSWFGTRGRLGIQIKNIIMPDGMTIPLNGEVYIKGSNRTALSVLLFLFVAWPCCFITGSKAEMPKDFETTAFTSAPITINMNRNSISSIKTDDILTNTGDTSSMQGESVKLPRDGIIYKKNGNFFKATIISIENDVLHYRKKDVLIQLPMSKVKNIKYE